MPRDLLFARQRRGPQVIPQDLWATRALSIRSLRVDLGVPLPNWEERRVNCPNELGFYDSELL